MDNQLPSKERATPLACPFCREAVSEHSDEAFWFSGDGPPPCYAVRCDSCGAQGPYGYGRERGDHWGAKDEAAKRWNKLPRPAPETCSRDVIRYIA
jgi:restriction alleviation protein Lar